MEKVIANENMGETIFNFENLNKKIVKITVNGDNLILKGQKEIKILFKDFIGCKIYKSENILKKSKLEIIFSEVYLKEYKKFGIKNLKNRKFITTDLFHDKITEIQKLKKNLMNKFYSQQKNNYKIKYNEKEDIYYYKKILILINKNSGKGKAELLYKKSQKILKANGIYFKKIFTKKNKFIQNFIKNLKKDDLLSYDVIVTISGDGTIHEILNGFFSRDDIDFEKEKLFLSNLPGGSGCCLIESLSKKSENLLSLENVLYALCHFSKEDINQINSELNNKKDNSEKIIKEDSENNSKDKSENKLEENSENSEKIKKKKEENKLEENSENNNIKNIHKVPLQINNVLLKDGTKKKIFSFCGFNYGYFSNVDIESEKFRFMGHYRFDFYAFIRYMYLRSYEISIYYLNEKNSNLKLPLISEKIEKNDKINFLRLKAYSFYAWSLPFFSREHLSSPLLRKKLGKFNLQIFDKKKGKINFFKYIVKHEKHVKDDLCVIDAMINEFRVIFHSEDKKKTISIDGENYASLDIQAIQSSFLNFSFYLII